MRSTCLGLMTLALVGATACDELDVKGRLGNGEFEYICGGPGDAACNGGETIFGFDLDRQVLPLAVGADFGLSFDQDGVNIAAASQQMVAVDGSTFHFTVPGTVDFLALSDEREVIDFGDLSALEATRLQLFYDGDAVDSVAGRTYQDLEIAAAPMGDGHALGGGMEYSWTLVGDGVTLSQGGSDNVATVVVESSTASATLTATTGALSASVTLTAE